MDGVQPQPSKIKQATLTEMLKTVTSILLILVLASLSQAHGISEADKQAILEGGNLRYLWLGAIHMVTGYDHLLFLFGVIFYLAGLKDILKFITAFTLGHSITLVLATFLEITANSYLVDAVIALSVCYKAFDNLDGFRKYLKVGSPHLLSMIFVFGLIHGFGLSTRLQEMPLPAQGLLARILSFNVGVELGQVAALSVLTALLAIWRKTPSFKKFGGAANALLLIAGLALFGYQLNGYFRGGEHDHDESHEESVPDSSHLDGVLSPGVLGITPKREESFSPLRPPEASDSADTANPAKVKPTHSHGHSHRHGNGKPHRH